MAVVEIDECSIEYFRARGEGGWPWSRQRHADLLDQLDRGAEYQADNAAGIYVARAEMNPLAFHAVLQKMAALGSQSPGLAQLYKTHPALDDRMDRIDQRGYGDLKAYTKRE